jgi:hypothetical protein
MTTMDLMELRLLAVGGILTVGIVMSLLGLTAAAVVERFGRISYARSGRDTGVPAVGPRLKLGSGRAQC